MLFKSRKNRSSSSLQDFGKLLALADEAGARGDHQAAEAILGDASNYEATFVDAPGERALLYVGLYHLLRAEPHREFRSTWDRVVGNQPATENRKRHLPVAVAYLEKSMREANRHAEWRLFVHATFLLSTAYALEGRKRHALGLLAQGLLTANDRGIEDHVEAICQLLAQTAAELRIDTKLEIPLSDQTRSNLQSITGRFIPKSSGFLSNVFPPLSEKAIAERFRQLISEPIVAVHLTFGPTLFVRLYGTHGVRKREEYSAYADDLRARIEGDHVALYTLMNWDDSRGRCYEFHLPSSVVAGLSALPQDAPRLFPHEAEAKKDEHWIDPGIKPLQDRTASILELLNVYPTRETAWTSFKRDPTWVYGRPVYYEPCFLYLNTALLESEFGVSPIEASALLQSEIGNPDRMIAAMFLRSRHAAQVRELPLNVESIDLLHTNGGLIAKIKSSVMELVVSIEDRCIIVPFDVLARIDTTFSLVIRLTDALPQLVYVLSRPDLALHRPGRVEKPLAAPSRPPMGRVHSSEFKAWIDALISGEQPVAFLAGAGVSRDEPANLWLANDIAGFVFALLSKCADREHLRAGDLHALLQAEMPLDQDATAFLRFEGVMEVLAKSIDPLLETLDCLAPHDTGFAPQPTNLHLFLAYALKQGCPVLTTNFDSLIEDALHRYHYRCTPLIYEDEYEVVLRRFRETNDLSVLRGRLYKIHGTFDRHGSDCSDAIIATLGGIVSSYLSAVSPDVPAKWQIVREVLSSHTLVVIGYSGSDYDFVPLLRDAAKKGPLRIVWVNHCHDREFFDVTSIYADGLSPEKLGQGAYAHLLWSIREDTRHERATSQPAVYLASGYTGNLGDEIPRAHQSPFVIPHEQLRKKEREQFDSRWSKLHLCDVADALLCIGFLHCCHRRHRDAGLKLVEESWQLYSARRDALAISMLFRIDKYCWAGPGTEWHPEGLLEPFPQSLRGESITFKRGNNAVETGQTLVDLGWKCFDSEKYLSALTAFRLAARTWRSFGLSGCFALIDTLNGLGYSEYQLGTYEHAFQTFSQGLRIAHAFSSHQAEMLFAHQAAMTVEKLGSRKFAAKLYQCSAELACEYGPASGALLAYDNLTSLLLGPGRTEADIVEAARSLANAYQLAEVLEERKNSFQVVRKKSVDRRQKLRREWLAVIGSDRFARTRASVGILSVCSDERFAEVNAEERARFPGLAIEKEVWLSDEPPREITIDPTIEP